MQCHLDPDHRRQDLTLRQAQLTQRVGQPGYIFGVMGIPLTQIVDDP